LQSNVSQPPPLNLIVHASDRTTEVGYRTKWLTRTVLGSRRWYGNPNHKLEALVAEALR
jgi:hypothetical protein